ncbi:MAG: phospholipase D-like domain-containing protein [Pseudomonadota bacterium]
MFMRWRSLFFVLLLLVQVNCRADETLIVEPDMGRAPILAAIKQAQSSVDLVMYGLTDNSFINALITAQSQHKNVRILLQHYPYQSTDENLKAIQELQAANMALRWPDDKFKLTHQKTFLFDGHSALVLTFNLTHSSFTKERNFGLLITDPGLVEKIQQVFNADWQHNAVNIHDPDLVFSPDASREQLLDLIDAAHASIKIYAEGLSDYQIVGALAKAARRGVDVAILTSTFHDKKPGKQFAYLTRAGVKINFSKNYIIHAKVMIIDDDRALLGSINFTRQSINNNRELSVIIHDQKIIHQLTHTFNSDWQADHHLARQQKTQMKQTVKLLKHWLRHSAHYL